MSKTSLSIFAAMTGALMLVLSFFPVDAQGTPLKSTPVKAKVMKKQVGDIGDALEILDVKEEGERMTLRVRNRTPFIVIVYIYGRRVGWLRPFRTGNIRGLRRGFHRLYAHSRWGSFYWGPRSTWVPGSWSLYR